MSTALSCLQHLNSSEGQTAGRKFISIVASFSPPESSTKKTPITIVPTERARDIGISISELGRALPRAKKQAILEDVGVRMKKCTENFSIDVLIQCFLSLKNVDDRSG